MMTACGDGVDGLHFQVRLIAGAASYKWNQSITSTATADQLLITAVAAPFKTTVGR